MPISSDLGWRYFLTLTREDSFFLFHSENDIVFINSVIRVSPEA